MWDSKRDLSRLVLGGVDHVSGDDATSTETKGGQLAAIKKI